jgi:organic radical activating enzyme
MTTINKAIINSNTSLLTQQLAKESSRQALNKDVSLPASANSVPVKIANLNSQLSSILDKLSDAKQAISQWGNITQEINQSKKAFAAEVLKRVKEQIRILMMLTGGDPKARARQIAILARELAAAAREYASASGDSPSASVAPTADSAGTTTPSTGDLSNAATAVADTSGATSGTVAAAEPSDPNAGNAVPDVSATPPSVSMQYQPGTTHQVNEQLGIKIAEYTRTSSTSQEDQAFAMEVRKLAAQLKALAKQNEVHAHKGKDQSTEREMADINDALREIEKSLSSLNTPNPAAPSINIVAG